MREHYNSRCVPPWSDEELRVIVEDAYRYGKNRPGIAAPENDFKDMLPVADTLPAPLASKPLLPTEKFIDTRADLSIGGQIEGLFDQGSFIVMYGDSGSGKSALAMDMALCIGAGIPWFGRKTEPGLVVFVAAESPGSARKRI